MNYFDGRYTSAAVEGINNKARVITKRCYGVMFLYTLWNRAILDLNRASEAVGRTIAELREITRTPEGPIQRFCTKTGRAFIFLGRAAKTPLSLWERGWGCGLRFFAQRPLTLIPSQGRDGTECVDGFL